MIPEITPEHKAKIEAALTAKIEAHQAWLALLPQITLGDFHDAQPTDDDEDTSAFDRWLDADFSITDDLRTIAWTEETSDPEFVGVWSYDLHDNEVFLGSWPRDTPVYACGV